MFEDCRNKRIVFVTHSVLNQNSIPDGTAAYPGNIRESMRIFITSNSGIVQMPCPELFCLGIDRGNSIGSSFPVVKENTSIKACMRTDSIGPKIDQFENILFFRLKNTKSTDFRFWGFLGLIVFLRVASAQLQILMMKEKGTVFSLVHKLKSYKIISFLSRRLVLNHKT
jgi:hypothetical protein